ncbi:MAG: nucleotidyltransferase [Burkholderiales bacterium]|nr:MAG: nucleotidyltransferase [Burkholderiales bacterium]
MGSHAYGTNIETSDKDIRGVFIQPLEDIFKYGYIEQVSDKTNDIVFYELKRFLDLVKTNNPNILELLNPPKDCIIYKDPLYDLIAQNAHRFVTKKCRWTFAGYAIEQIRKARGYNKMMNWEESKMTRKTVLDFCYVLDGGGTKPFSEWLQKNRPLLTQKDFGLAAVDHAHDLYAMYINPAFGNWGIVSDYEKANDVQLTSIPKGIPIEGYLTFNKDAYSTHCKNYASYQEWLKNRNEDRFKMNKEHGKNFDSKNLMHTFRLLSMALEIAATGEIRVRRSDEEREKLLKIRHGEYEYDILIEEAEKMIENLDDAFDKSNLPDNPEPNFISDLELEIRNKRYGL